MQDSADEIMNRLSPTAFAYLQVSAIRTCVPVEQIIVSILEEVAADDLRSENPKSGTGNPLLKVVENGA